MIKNIAFRASTKCIRINWSRPKFPPYLYLQSITCKLRLDRRPYLQRIITLERYTTSSGLRFLKPDSKCDIKLTAVYNPASLDPGVHINVYVPFDCELNQCKLQEMYSFICIESLRLPVGPEITYDLL